MSAKNTTVDNLLDALFEQIDIVRDSEGEEVDEAIKKAGAVSDLADKALRTYGVVIKTVQLQDKRAGYRSKLTPLPRVLTEGCDHGQRDKLD